LFGDDSKFPFSTDPCIDIYQKRILRRLHIKKVVIRLDNRGSAISGGSCWAVRAGGWAAGAFLHNGQRRNKTNEHIFLFDTGSYMLCINESIQEQLQFPIMEKRKGETADGRIVEFDAVRRFGGQPGGVAI
jgi:hypothetical protein